MNIAGGHIRLLLPLSLRLYTLFLCQNLFDDSCALFSDLKISNWFNYCCRIGEVYGAMVCIQSTNIGFHLHKMQNKRVCVVVSMVVPSNSWHPWSTMFPSEVSSRRKCLGREARIKVVGNEGRHNDRKTELSHVCSRLSRVACWRPGRTERYPDDSPGRTNTKAMRNGRGGRHLFALSAKAREEDVPKRRHCSDPWVPTLHPCFLHDHAWGWQHIDDRVELPH